MIRNPQGAMAVPGDPLPSGAITPGEMRLNYTLSLVSNRDTLQAGDYRSAIRFRMNYY